jgi:thiol-disulfide isomerase/thioredoxin
MNMKKELTIIFVPLVAGIAYAQASRYFKITDTEFKYLASIVIAILSSIIIFSITKPQNKKALLWIYIKLSIYWLFWDMLVRVFEGWQDSFYSLPRILCQLLSIHFVYQCFTKSLKSIILSVFILSLGMFISLKYLHPFATHFTSYGAFSSKISEKLPNNLHILIDGQPFDKNKYNNKYVVLDFWTSSCIVCFEKFPILDKMAEEYKGSSFVKVISVQVLYHPHDSVVAQKKLLPKKYSFPIAFGDKNTCKTLGILSFPTVMVFHKDEIVFKGDIEGAKQFINLLR